MHVVLNSDILLTGHLWTGVPQQVRLLAGACRKNGHVIVVPETALLEFNHYQGKSVSEGRSHLDEAYRTLEEYGISFDRKSLDSAVIAPDLVELITDLGAKIEVAEPTLEDFQEAHRRACLHLEPQPPDAKSDEMRDLVIWMVAVRIAQSKGGALLVSRDVVHVHGRGDSEAGAVGLVRVQSSAEALEYLEVETPAGKLFRSLMNSAWPEIARTRLPLTNEPTVLSVAQPVFVQGSDGIASASCHLKVRTKDGKALEADVEVQVLGDKQKVTMSNIITHKSSSESIEVESKYLQNYMTNTAANAEEDLSELRRLFGGDS